MTLEEIGEILENQIRNEALEEAIKLVFSETDCCNCQKDSEMIATAIRALKREEK